MQKYRDGKQWWTIRCSKSKSAKCYYSVRIINRANLTPEDPEFSNLENWEIIENRILRRPASSMYLTLITFTSPSVIFSMTENEKKLKIKNLYENDRLFENRTI